MRVSKYLPMRDGTKIAIEVFLPDDEAPETIPAMLHQTRYFRSVEVTSRLARRLEPSFNMVHHTRTRFLEAGYAWIDVDVRGSGASTGVRPCPWSPDEVTDSAQVVDWIVAQPWSNGAVGATGISYAGTTAEMLLTQRHPAVKAIAPRFSLFDVYTDVMSPGGVPLRWFTDLWNQVNTAFDAAEYDKVVGIVTRLFIQSLSAGGRDPRTPRFASWTARLDSPMLEAMVRGLVRFLGAGIRPVDKALLAAAVEEHLENYDVHEQAGNIEFRDDLVAGAEAFDHLSSWSAIEGSVGRFSPHSYQEDIKASGAAIYSFTGWYDGAYPFASIKRHLTTQSPGGRLIIGPWEHGGHLCVSPHSKERLSGFDHEAELLAFFDHHLKGAPAPETPSVRYFTMGEEKWKSADTWPPPGAHTQALYFSSGRRLSAQAPAEEHTEEFDLPTDTTTGGAARWRSYIGPHHFIGYPDRARQTKGVARWISEPLSCDIEVTGHPIVNLWLSARAGDGDLFVYLEEMMDAEPTYVTEGMLRVAHHPKASGPGPYNTPLPFWRSYRREDALDLPASGGAEVSVALLPTSYMFRKGASISIVLTGADIDNFGPPKALGAVELHCGPTRPSHLDLPLPAGTSIQF